MSIANNTTRSGNPCDRRQSGSGTFVALLGSAVMVAISGCSSSSVKPQVVSILVADANGTTGNPQPSSLTVGSGIYLDATLSNDGSSLGVDWTVSCGSAPPLGTPLPPGVTVNNSCGTFTPVHTMSGPVPTFSTTGAGYVTLYTPPTAPPTGGNVTIYAKATADPSRFASLTLPVVGLPVSIGFAPQPPSTLAVNGTTALKAVVSNDYVAGGVSWSLTCKSSSCGTLSPAQTASGAATTYVAPAAVPTGGTVTVTATSVTDSTKSVAATITIAPLTLTVAPATLSVAADAAGLLNATVSNDVSNAGVDWTLNCGTAGECGSVTAHTASGAPAIYTAPSAVPTGGTVTVTATSSADHTVSGSSIVTVTAVAAAVVSGSVRVGLVPVSGASVNLYAAGSAGYGSASQLLSASNPIDTDVDGSFTVRALTACPRPDILLYAAASGGYVQGSALKGLSLIVALGPCSQFANGGDMKSAVTLNEITTVAAAYSLSAFMRDAAHVGSLRTNYEGMVAAFATAHDLADIMTGEARSATLANDASVPQREINSMADAVHRCLMASAGSDDGQTCKTAFGLSPGAGSADTLQAVLAVARRAAGASESQQVKALYEFSEGNGPFQPSLQQQPEDWTIRLSFPTQPAARTTAVTVGSDRIVDGAGRLWTVIDDAPQPVGSLNVDESSVVTAASRRLGIDRAGNVWISGSEDPGWIMFVGIATPVLNAPSLDANANFTERQP